MNKTRILKLVNTPIRDDPRAINEGMSLVDLGYDVTAIGLARDPEGGQMTCDTIRGMKTILVPMVTSHHPLLILKALIALVRGYLTETTVAPTNRISNMLSFVFFNLWLLRVAGRFKPDVVHCHDVLPLPAAWLIAKWNNVPLIYDARESVPDLYTGLKGRMMTAIEQFVLVRAHAVITVGERLANKLKERGAKHDAIIGNWKRLEDFQSGINNYELPHQQYSVENYKVIITFLGDLTPTTYDILPLLAAVKECPDVMLFIGGNGALAPIVSEASHTTSNIQWLGWVNFNDLVRYTKLSDAIYACLKPDFPQAYYVAPNKLFEAFAAGKPIIARKGVGEIGDILERIPAGILLEEVTPDTLMDAFQLLGDSQHLHTLQQAALEGRRLYNWQVAEERLKTLYEEFTNPTREN